MLESSTFTNETKVREKKSTHAGKPRATSNASNLRATSMGATHMSCFPH